VAASSLAGEESEGSMAGMLELAMAHRDNLLCRKRRSDERGGKRENERLKKP
jgi:hypothetical protein